MMVQAIEVNLLPYDDNSGHRAELKLTEGTAIRIKQGNDVITFNREDWYVVRDAIDKMFDAIDELA